MIITPWMRSKFIVVLALTCAPQIVSGFALFKARNTCNSVDASSCKTSAVAFQEESIPALFGPSKKGAISTHIGELSDALGGVGRAQLVWDLYSIGVDPALFFDENLSTRLDAQDGEQIRKLLPGTRRSQTLGKDALQRLSSLYKDSGGCVEGGVATLSHISVSADQTTKLLLRLVDGLEVETVIIPWQGVRSTLCVSSQVGCRQGMLYMLVLRCTKQRLFSLSRYLKDAHSVQQEGWVNYVPLPPMKSLRRCFLLGRSVDGNDYPRFGTLYSWGW